jgi:diguanylate cyclase (GGDEF)-like protein
VFVQDEPFAMYWESSLNSEHLRCEELLDFVLEQSKIALWELDIPNKHAEAIFVPLAFFKNQRNFVEDIPQSLIMDHAVLPDSIECVINLHQRILNGASTASAVLHIQGASDSQEWVEVAYKTIKYDVDHTPLLALGIAQKVTEKINVELDLRRERRQTQRLASRYIAIFELSLLSNTVKKIYDYSKNSPAITDDFATYAEFFSYLCRLINPEDITHFRDRFNYPALLTAVERKTARIYGEYRISTDNEKAHWIGFAAHLPQSSASVPSSITFFIKDIDNQKRELIAYKEQAQRDPLTSLYNRNSFENLANCILQNSNSLQEISSVHTLFFFDIDNFKHINDTFGHNLGDEVLRKVALALLEKKGTRGIAGRLGGDEFILFLPDTTNDIALHRMHEIKQLLSEKALIASGLPCITFSIGVASAPKDGSTFKELYQRADIAQYSSKKRGKNRVMFYDSSLENTFVDPQKLTSVLDLDTKMHDQDAQNIYAYTNMIFASILICSTNATFKLLYANTTASELLGFGAFEKLGQAGIDSALKLVDESEANRFKVTLRKCQREGEDLVQRFSLKMPDGTSFPMLFNLRRLSNTCDYANISIVLNPL